MPTPMTDNSGDKFDAIRALEMDNIAEYLSEDVLNTIGREVVDGYKIDERSRTSWFNKYEKQLDLAMQIANKKNWPWPNAANVKYPLLTQGAISFQARIYPALLSGPKIVKGRVIGKDATGEKTKSGVRVETHMSYQILEQMTEWEPDMDRLTLALPIVGSCFKKSYFGALMRRNVSELVLPHDLCVHYFAKDLESARRVTHILELSRNDLHERMKGGTYVEMTLGTTDVESESRQRRRKIMEKASEIKMPAGDDNKNIPREILEQHTFRDLDGDGYEEPYIITVDLQTSKVLRIVARFEEDGIQTNAEGEVIRIAPVNYFTKYGFIPSPDGSFYDMGFGQLLGSLNEALNTTINQLLDAGTLANMQSGFVARGIRVMGGRKRFIPGEWKVANTSGVKLKDGIVPIPAKEPSHVLMSLLTFLLTSGEKLASIIDSLTGENPGQNQKATTTLAVIEQGLKVFSAIQKRIYRSMKDEFKKLHRLNAIYLDEREYYQILDDPEATQREVYKLDYRGDWTDVIPFADPNVSSETQMLMKAQVLMEMMSGGIELNREEVRRRMLEATNQPNIDALIQPNPQTKSIEQLKLELEQAKHNHKVEVDNEEQKRKDADSEAGNALKEAQALLTAYQAQTEAGTARHNEIAGLLETIDLIFQHQFQREEAERAAKNAQTSAGATGAE